MDMSEEDGGKRKEISEMIWETALSMKGEIQFRTGLVEGMLKESALEGHLQPFKECLRSYCENLKQFVSSSSGIALQMEISS